jgi:hypothetical protein
VAPEALEARAVQQALTQQVQVLLERLPRGGRPDVESLALAAAAAGDVDTHAG